MARETLRALDEDVQRLLLAGGSVAGTDDGLNTRRDELAGFAAKVPALGKVAEQVGKVVGAKPRIATSELLTLAAMSNQLRAAQAAPAKPDGALAPVPAVEPVDTPLGAGEIEPIYKALTTRGSGRDAVVSDAAERGAIKDLRLLHPWVHALGDSVVADTVADEVIPKLGPAAFPIVKSAFRLDGGAGDARRLACLVKLDPAGARALVEEAIEKGSPAVRGAALLELASIDMSAAEPRALAALANDRSKDVRQSAVEVLGKAKGSDAALDALLGALRTGKDDLHWAVTNALGALEHPQANARLLALLTPEALDVKPYVPPKAKKGVKLSTAQQKAAQKAEEKAMREAQERYGYVERIVQVLGNRKAAEAEAALIELFDSHKHPDVRLAAGQALVNAALPAGIAAVEAKLEDKNDALRALAISAALADKARGYDKLAPYFEPKRLADKKLSVIAGEVMGEIEYKDQDELDPRWADVALALLSDKHFNDSATSMLGNLKDARAVEPLIALLRAGGKDLPYSAWDTLAEFKDKRAVPVALEVLANGKRNGEHSDVIDLLRAVDDPAVVPPLQDWVSKRAKKVKKGQHDWLLKRAENALEYLQRDRTLA